MGTIDRSNIEITATDKTEKAFRSAQQRLKQFGDSLGNVGRQMTMRVSAPVAALGAGILKTAGDFEAAMNRVKAVSGASGTEFDKLTAQAQELGRTTKFSASEAADAMGFLAMAGNDANNILSAMPATLQLAASAGVELGTAADTVTNILAGFRLETGELSRANDVLVSAMTGSNTSLDQLGEALKYVGPVASSFGLSLEETTAAVGMLGNAGIQASMAGTTLRGMLTRLANPTKEAATMLQELGISAMNADGSMKPLVDIMGQIEESGMNSAQAMEIFGQRAGPGVLALVGQGTEALQQLQARLEESGGTAENIANVQMQGLNGAMKSLQSAAEGLGLAIASSGLLEFATNIVTKFAEWVRVMGETNPEILQLGTVVAGAAAAIGPLALVLAGVTTALGALISPIGLVVAAVAGLTAAWVAFGDDIKAGADAAVGYVKDMVTAIKSELVDRFNGIVDSIGEKIDAVTGFFRDMWDQVVGNSFVPDMIDAIRDEFGRLPDVMVDPAEDATSTVSGFFDDMGSRVGGIIKGLIKGTTDLKSALKSLAEDVLDRFIDRGIDSLFSQGNLGGLISGGGIGGGIGHGTGIGGSVLGGLKGLGKTIAGWFGGGASVPAGAAAPGMADAAFGFSGPGASGIGAWGAAVPLGIAAFGFGRIASKKAQRRENQSQFFNQVGTGTFDQLNPVSAFRGMDEATGELFVTMNEGWHSTIEALKEANALIDAQGAMYDERGNELLKISGNAQQVKTALSNAAATGFEFAGSLGLAIEKGNSLRVSIQGDSEAIQTALNAATAMGIGGFQNLEQTATGVSATLTGDLQRWNDFMQSFVNESIRAAISGVGALGSEAGNATQRFLELAKAASSVNTGRTAGATIRVPDHRSGLDYVPYDGYLAKLHQGERVQTATERQQSERSAMDDRRIVGAIEKQTREIRRQARARDYQLA